MLLNRCCLSQALLWIMYDMWGHLILIEALDSYHGLQQPPVVYRRAFATTILFSAQFLNLQTVKALVALFNSQDNWCLLSVFSWLGFVSSQARGERITCWKSTGSTYMFNNLNQFEITLKWWPCKVVLTWKTYSESLILGSKLNIWPTLSPFPVYHRVIL